MKHTRKVPIKNTRIKKRERVNELHKMKKANEPSSKKMEKAKNVFLVATKHEAQYPSKQGSEDFRQLVTVTCRSQDIKAIGEEMNRDALNDNNTRESVCKQVADKLKIQHRYCDPSIEKQISLGIEEPRKVTPAEHSIDPDLYKMDSHVERTFGIREGEWLKCLLELDTWPVLFVCGYNHTKSFPELLHGNGIDMPEIFKNK